MKFNLKNQPRFEKGITGVPKKYYDEWFEGFEKELRSQLKNVKELGGSMGEGLLIKEILGE